MSRSNESLFSEMQMRNFGSTGKRELSTEVSSNRTILATVLIVAFTVILGIMMWPLALRHVYVCDDLLNLHLPSRFFYSTQLKNGEPFDWNDAQYAGQFVSGEGQGGYYHPLHWALYKIFPLETAFVLELTLVYLFAFLGMTMWLRRHFRPLVVPLYGGFVFALCSFNVAHFVHPNMIWINIHLPWLLWCIDIFFFDRNLKKRIFAWAAIAILTASQLLLGHPHMLWITILGQIGFILFIMWTCRREYYAANNPPRLDKIPATETRHPGLQAYPLLNLSMLATAYGMGALLGAVQLVPTMELLRHSPLLNVDYNFVCFNSLHPANIVQMVAPYLIDDRGIGPNWHECTLYVGAVPLALCFWLVLSWKRLGRLQSAVAALLGFAVIVSMLALGKYTPLYQLHYFLPIIGNFRCPARYVALLQLCIATGSSIGLWLLMHGNTHRFQSSSLATKLLWTLFLASVLLTFITVVTIYRMGRLDRLPGWLSLSVGPILVLGAVVLVISSVRGWRGAALCLVILTVLDLGCYDLTMENFNHSTLAELEKNTSQPPSTADDRLLYRFQPRYGGNLYTLFGYKLARSYGTLLHTRQLDYWHSTTAQRVAGVAWYGPWKPNANVKDESSLDSFDQKWLAVPHPLPFARFVTKTFVSNAPGEDISKINLESIALVESPIELTDGSPGTVSNLMRRSGHIQLEVQCPSRQLLIIAENNYPGWTCRIDGVRSDVLGVNGDFMGCVIDSGKHYVAFEFRSASVSIGRILSICGLAILAIVIFIGIVMSK